VQSIANGIAVHGEIDGIFAPLDGRPNPRAGDCGSSKISRRAADAGAGARYRCP